MPTRDELTHEWIEIAAELRRKDLSDEARERLMTRMMEVNELQKEAAALEFTAPRFLLAMITKGIGVPEVTVRNWLTRNQIDLGAAEDHQPNKKRRFSIRDVLVIATCFQLSRVGVPVSVFSIVYTQVIGIARMYLSGRPIGMMQNPVGILFNDGEWKLVRSFDSGPGRLANLDTPAITIVINYEKIIFDTLKSLGMNVRMVSASDIEPEA